MICWWNIWWLTKKNFFKNVDKTQKSCWCLLLMALQWNNTTLTTQYFLAAVFSHHLCPWSYFLKYSLIISVSGVKSSRYYPDLILNITWFWILLTYFELMVYQLTFHASSRWSQNSFESLIWNKTLQAVQNLYLMLFLTF